MIWTIVGGAAALVVIVKSALVAPAGTTIDGGTDATPGSWLNSRTVVGERSGNASVTVPTAGAPSRTIDGETDSEEMLPAADAVDGTTSSTDSTDRRTRRRMVRTTRARRDRFGRRR